MISSSKLLIEEVASQSSCKPLIEEMPINPESEDLRFEIDEPEQSLIDEMNEFAVEEETSEADLKDINPEFTPSYDSVQNEHFVQLLQDMKSMDDTNFTKTGIMDPSKVVIDDSPVDKSKSADKNTHPLADWDDNELD